MLLLRVLSEEMGAMHGRGHTSILIASYDPKVLMAISHVAVVSGEQN